MIVSQQTIDLFNERHIYTSYGTGCRFKVGDKLNVDPDAVVEPYVMFSGGDLPSIGAATYTWSGLANIAKVGRYCSLAGGVRVIGDRHPYERFTTSTISYENRFVISKEMPKTNSEYSFQFVNKSTPPRVIIGNDVWIGTQVALQQGITIGDGAIIATGAIVTKDVMPYTIVGGVPAKVIKQRFPDRIINMLMSLRWWDYNYADFKNMRADIPIEAFIDKIGNDIAKGELLPYKPQVTTGREILSTENL